MADAQPAAETSPSTKRRPRNRSPKTSSTGPRTTRPACGPSFNEGPPRLAMYFLTAEHRQPTLSSQQRVLSDSTSQCQCSFLY